MEKVIETLVEKAGKCDDACQAMQFTQAACNAVNALRMLKELRAQPK